MRRRLSARPPRRARTARRTPTPGYRRRNAETLKRAKLDELNEIRKLNNADLQRPGYFAVRSPMTGRMLNTDFRENLVGRKRPAARAAHSRRRDRT